MYKSTEIFIPIKVDEQFDLCPFLSLSLLRHSFFPSAVLSSVQTHEGRQQRERERDRLLPASSSSMFSSDAVFTPTGGNRHRVRREKISSVNHVSMRRFSRSWCKHGRDRPLSIIPVPEAPPTGSSDEVLPSILGNLPRLQGISGAPPDHSGSPVSKQVSQRCLSLSL